MGKVESNWHEVGWDSSNIELVGLVQCVGEGRCDEVTRPQVVTSHKFCKVQTPPWYVTCQDASSDAMKEKPKV